MIMNNIIVLHSKRMDAQPSGFVRMMFSARKRLELIQITSTVNLRKKDGETSKFSIKQAFLEDIRELKYKIKDMDTDRVFFVNEKDFHDLAGENVDTRKIVKIEKEGTSKNNNDFLIGTDPEFLMLTEKGNINDARLVIPRETLVIPHYGNIGNDGVMVEIRPNAEKNVDLLINNIVHLFNDEEMFIRAKQLDWRAECFTQGHSVGGHIHIGNSNKIDKLQKSDTHILFEFINKVLDELLAVPCIKIDKNHDGHQRRQHYGSYGHYRVDHGRLEHRTLSGMWLSNPTLAKGVLGTAKAIVDSIYTECKENKIVATIKNIIKNNDPNHFFPEVAVNGWAYILSKRNWSDIEICKKIGICEETRTLKKILDKSDDTYIDKGFINKWYKKMKAMDSFTKYGEYITSLRDIMLRIDKGKGDIDNRLKINWLEDHNE